MKRLLIVFGLIIALFPAVKANLATPQACVSEIYIDSTGNWTIEMGFWELVSEIDSIRLVTSSGSSLINEFETIEINGWFWFLGIIDVSNLETPVSINPEGDFVKLISYAWGEEPFDQVIFGDYPGSFLDCIKDGESVAFVIYNQSAGLTSSFCMNKFPSLGAENDTTGALGQISGMVYDPDGNPMSEGFFRIASLYNVAFYIQADGSYSERIFARRLTFDTITVYLGPWPYEKRKYAIEPYDHCLETDSSHYQDIITTSLITGFDDNFIDEENAVTIAPNPFSDKVVFYFKQKDNYYSERMDLSVLSLDGKEIHHVSLMPGQKRYDWAPGNTISSGTFIYRLTKNNRVIKSGKFIKL